MIFALSGAVGPIVGQNFGAHEFDRVKESLTKALQFCALYVIGVSLILMLLQEQVISIFDMKGDSAELIRFFCTYIAVFFVFSGALFVANASFNNLGKAKYSTFFNIGKATIGTIPFVYFGAQWGGVYGVLVGQAIGSIIFAVLGVYTAFRLVENVRITTLQSPLSEHVFEDKEVLDTELSPSSTSPLSSSCALAQLTEEQDSEAARDERTIAASTNGKAS